MRKKTAIAYWLVPAKPEGELFNELIRILSKQFDAPAFEPHLTLLVTPQARQLPKEILRKIHAGPIRLAVREIAFSSKFTKTLFVRFQPNSALGKLIRDLGGHSRTLRDPHLSLLYKKLPVGVKREIAASIKLPFSRVVFDRVKAVRCAS